LTPTNLGKEKKTAISFFLMCATLKIIKKNTVMLKFGFLSFLCSDIDIIEWHEFLTPQLKLSQLFKAKPEEDVSY